jgi:carbamoyltransferase
MLVEIEWHPTDRQLRVFGVSGLLASLAAALVLTFVWGVAVFWAILALAAGAAIFLCSLLAPTLTRILFIGLTLVGMPVGFVVSFLVLAAFYFLLLTPVALFFRLIGRDPLCRSWRGRPALEEQKRIQGQDALATSYWVPHRPNNNAERYFHQF